MGRAYFCMFMFVSVALGDSIRRGGRSAHVYGILSAAAGPHMYMIFCWPCVAFVGISVCRAILG